MTGEQHKRWRRYIRGLRERCSPMFHVDVRRVPPERLGDANGDCQWRPRSKTFLIRVSRDLDYQHAGDVLCHEWAHTLSWDVEDHRTHGPQWGVAYARVYRAMLAISADWEAAEG